MRTYVISSRFWLFLLIGCLFLLSACGETSSSNPRPTPTAVPVVQDVYGTPIAFPHTAPQRIVSLVPNISEILGALHLEKRVVGVDFNTNYPPALAKLQKVSDINATYNVEGIVALHPDLVLSDGGLSRTYDPQLTRLGLHVVDLPLTNFQQSLQKINLVGRLTFTESTANGLVNQLKQQLNQIKATVQGTSAPKVLLEVDDSTPGKPYVFGGGSFGDEMLQALDATNIFHSNTSGGGYPQVTDEAIVAANPQFVILTEDPLYGGNPQDVYKRPNWGGIDAVQKKQVYRINSDITQRAGPRLVEGFQCMAQIIHPAQFHSPLPAYCSGNV